ncbi:MAG: gamma-glutamyl-gamma-aminobutyrate hydrolase family protein [Candidatus Binatus sp.]|uniref:type 1 glutamine amidotransferase n=1 Tax=Candidatus Binatus sp. TaxID=2811406 RepID=UPI003C76E2B8
MTRVIALQHYGCETLGALADALARAQIEWQYASLADGQQTVPDLREIEGLVVLGGPFSVYQPERYPFLRSEIEVIKRALALGKPVLGICLGSQLLASALGAKVRAAEAPEIGWLAIRLEPAARDDYLFHDLPESFITCVWHGDIFDLPPGAVSLARSITSQCQAYRYGTTAYGLLFHLEMKPEMVKACVTAFEPRLRKVGLDTEHCVAEAARHITAAAPVAERVFGRWAELVWAGAARGALP